MSFQEFQIYEIEESGDRNRLSIGPDELSYYLNPEKTFVIVKEDIRRIFFWKGAKAPIRKRFLGSRIATEIQGELMKEGFHLCKILSIDQGDEADEFLNVFGLESMEVKERLPDKVIFMNSAREKLELQKKLDTKVEFEGTSKLDEIKKLLEPGENMLWIKSTEVELNQDSLKVLMKNKKYKARIKNLAKPDDIVLENYEKRDVITSKKILTNNKYNPLIDFSGIPERFLEIKGDIAILTFDGLRAFDVTESKGSYDIWFNAEPEKKGDMVFLFEDLSQGEYNKLIDVMIGLKFRAQIPTEGGKLTYARRN